LRKGLAELGAPATCADPISLTPRFEEAHRSSKAFMTKAGDQNGTEYSLL
jgi:hypothetical protein